MAEQSSWGRSGDVMPESAAGPQPEPARIVLLIREPAGTFYQQAQAIIRSMGHRVVAILTSAGPPTRRTDNYQQLIAQTPKNVDVIVSNFPNRWAALLAPYRPDLILLLGFSWKLPPELLSVPRIGTVNMHDALLPRYRGRGDWALQWMLRNDEDQGGLTFHWVDNDWDAGAVIVQRGFPIEDDDDIETLMGKILALALELLPIAIDRAVRGDPGTPQGDGGFYCAPIEDAWRTIDWSAPARSVHNQVRSWLGEGALANVDGSTVRVIKTRLTEGALLDSPPGTVLACGEGTFTIQCGDGPLDVLRYTVEPARTAG